MLRMTWQALSARPYGASGGKCRGGMGGREGHAGAGASGSALAGGDSGTGSSESSADSVAAAVAVEPAPEAPCAHMLFVMTRVLRVPPSNPLVWQLSLMDRELDEAGGSLRTRTETLLGT